MARLLLIHGSAADRTTWTVPSALLGKTVDLVAYDREQRATISEHVDDAVVQIGKEPVFVCGSSFGAVVALELTRTHPALVEGAILCEPPLPADEEIPVVPPALGAEFERLIEAGQGRQAGELFLRTVLGDELYERIPTPFQDHAKSLYMNIRADIAALGAYPVRYQNFAEVRTPILLLGGARSHAMFGETLGVLDSVLPNSKRITLAGAGHMLHAEASRGFAAAVLDFVGVS